MEREKLEDGKDDYKNYQKQNIQRTINFEMHHQLIYFKKNNHCGKQFSAEDKKNNFLI